MNQSTETIEQPLVSDLLRQAAICPGEVRIRPWPGGRNNRAFVVETGETRYFLKKYFRSELDPRDRFAAETSFLSFCGAHGLIWTPRLIAANMREGIALMEFIDGNAVNAATSEEQDVDQAIAFLKDVNRFKNEGDARNLPPAADMRDTVSAHVALVDRRMERLAQIKPDSPEHQEAIVLVEEHLLPLWTETRARITADAGRELDEPWPKEAMVISPSDFGFHNAIRRPDGRLVFVDFEYAGWDDPAKTAADFFYQPAVPPPLSRREDFEAAVAEASGAGERFRRRVNLLRPLFGIKWCCILLNEFLPADAVRRGYAEPGLDWQARRRKQVESLRRLLDRLEQEAKR